MEFIEYKIKDDSGYEKDYDLDGIATVYKDLVYDIKSEKEKLDLYIPCNSEGPYPLIIYIHGGGLLKGDKTRHIRPIFQGFQYGYAVAGVNYRCMDECQYPGMVYDVTTAIRYLKANAEKFNLDPERFIVWGETHGAFLACQVGINGGKGSIDDMSAGYSEYSSKVAGIVDYWAFTSFEELYNLNTILSRGKDNPVYLEEQLFGAKGKELKKILRSTAQPLKDITGNESPFYIVHGDLDYEMPLTFSKSYYYTLKNAGNDVSLEIVSNTEHGLPNYVKSEQIEGTYQFIHKVFNNQK